MASYALGVPAVDCTLTPFDALWQNKVGGLDRAAPASAFCDGALQDALSSGEDSELVDRYAVVIAAGAAAEALEYGRARLHAHDERILVSLFREDYRSAAARGARARCRSWASAARPCSASRRTSSSSGAGPSARRCWSSTTSRISRLICSRQHGARCRAS